MNTRKSFWLVEGGKVTPATQDTPFDGMDNVLIFARTSIEAAIIAKAYEDLLITVDNVTADNGETVSALSMSDDQMVDLIDSHLDSEDTLVAEALRVIEPQSTKIQPEIKLLTRPSLGDGKDKRWQLRSQRFANKPELRRRRQAIFAWVLHTQRRAQLRNA